MTLKTVDPDDVYSTTGTMTVDGSAISSETISVVALLDHQSTVPNASLEAIQVEVLPDQSVIPPSKAASECYAVNDARDAKNLMNERMSKRDMTGKNVVAGVAGGIAGLVFLGCATGIVIGTVTAIICKNIIDKSKGTESTGTAKE